MTDRAKVFRACAHEAAHAIVANHSGGDAYVSAFTGSQAADGATGCCAIANASKLSRSARRVIGVAGAVGDALILNSPTWTLSTVDAAFAGPMTAAETEEAIHAAIWILRDRRNAEWQRLVERLCLAAIG